MFTNKQITNQRKTTKKCKTTKTRFDHVYGFFSEVSETEIEEMFDVADTDRDGIIGYPEFMVRDVQLQIKYNYKAKYN